MTDWGCSQHSSSWHTLSILPRTKCSTHTACTAAWNQLRQRTAVSKQQQQLTQSRICPCSTHPSKTPHGPTQLPTTHQVSNDGSSSTHGTQHQNVMTQHCVHTSPHRPSRCRSLHQGFCRAPLPPSHRALQCVRDARSKFVAGVGTSYGDGFGFRNVCNDGAQTTYFAGDTEGQGIEVSA